MNNVGLEVVFWTILSVYLLAKLGYLKKQQEKSRWHYQTQLKHR